MLCGDRLADHCPEGQKAIEQDVGKGQVVATDELTIPHHVAEPLQAILGDSLQFVGRNRTHKHDPRFEQLATFSGTEGIAQGLADVQVDATRPHACLGSRFRRSTDQHGGRLHLFEIFTDRGDLTNKTAIVQFQSWSLACSIDRGVVRRAAVFTAHQVDRDDR